VQPVRKRERGEGWQGKDGSLSCIPEYPRFQRYRLLLPPPLLPQRVGALWVSCATRCPCRSQGAPSLLPLHPLVPREAPPRRDADATSIPPRVIARYEFHVALARKTTLRARNEGEDEDVLRVEAKKPEGIRLIRFYDPAAGPELARASPITKKRHLPTRAIADSAAALGVQAIRKRFMGLETRKTMEKGEAGPDRSGSIRIARSCKAGVRSRRHSARPRDDTENTSGDVDV